MIEWTSFEEKVLFTEDVNTVLTSMETNKMMCNIDCSLHNPLCPSPRSEEREKLMKYEFPRFIYLDNNATHPITQEVRDRMSYALTFIGNASSNHMAGQKVRAAIEDARDAIAEELHISESKNLLFTGSGSEANNMFLKGVAFKNLYGPRKKILVSAIEHKAILSTAKYLEERFGFECIVLPVTKDGIVDPNILKQNLSGEVLLVSIMSANNEIGTILPIDTYCEIIKEYDADILFHSDAVQTIGKCKLPAIDNLDAATFTAHKFGGPTGIGVLYLKNIKIIDPLIHGGSQEFVKRAGTYNPMQIIGMAVAIREVAKIDKESILKFRLYAETKLKELGALINCEKNDRLINTISATLPGITAEDAVNYLSERGVFIGTGSACNSYEKNPSFVLKAIGLTDEEAYGTIRISLNRYTTLEDIDIFNQLLKQYIQQKGI